MPTARAGFGVAVVGGKIYAIGGTSGDNGYLNTVEVYNPQTDLWSTCMPMPTPRSGFAIAVYNNKIYVIGGTMGNGYLGNNEVYDTVTNSWQTRTSMPTPRADLSACVVDDQFYLVGGKKYSGINPYYKETDLNEIYNPVNDTWTTGPSMITAVEGYASAVLNGKIYILGGSSQSAAADNSVVTDASQVFDPHTGIWNLTTRLPDATSYAAAVSTTGLMAPQRIYCVGGYSNEFSAQTAVYFPENNSWNLAQDMPTARANLCVATLNDLVYAIGGLSGGEVLATNEVYTPYEYGTVAPKIQITSPTNKTYASVTLSFTVNRGAEWLAYSVDGGLNVTVTSATQLFGLAQGGHRVVMYANDSAGNMGVSDTVYFSIDTLPPTVNIILPQNTSYQETDIQLQFITNENVTLLAYCLDGKENITIVGNVTLPALSEGSHKLTLYASDELGNSDSYTIYFSITPFPTVLVVAIITIAIIIGAGGYIFIKRRKTPTTPLTTTSSS